MHRDTAKQIESVQRQDPWSFRLDDVRIVARRRTDRIFMRLEETSTGHGVVLFAVGYDRDLNGTNENHRNAITASLSDSTLLPLLWLSFFLFFFSFIFLHEFNIDLRASVRAAFSRFFRSVISSRKIKPFRRDSDMEIKKIIDRERKELSFRGDKLLKFLDEKEAASSNSGSFRRSW